MKQAKDYIIFPLDVSSSDEAKNYVELLADHADVFLLTLESERRRARSHPHAPDLRKSVQEFLAETVGEVLLVAIGTHVSERQHRD